MNFEVIDNGFQVLALLGAAGTAFWFALRRQSRACLILALGYTSFAFGTLFFVLHLAILGYVPQIFYVAESSWLAAYLFFLSYQILRCEPAGICFSLPALLAALAAAAAAEVLRIFGPSWLMSTLFAATAGALVYLAVVLLPQHTQPVSRRIDGCLIAAVLLQLGNYLVSIFLTDYTHFNLYFAVDILLTLNLIRLLPLTVREDMP